MKKIKLILGFICIILLSFVIFFLYSWPEEWPGAAQATLAAAIMATIVSILGIYLKFFFNQINYETEYNKKISEKMMLKLHKYAEKYYLPLARYAGSSADQLEKILTSAKASPQEKQLALFFITKYFQYGLNLSSERGCIIFLKDFNSESNLKTLNLRVRQNLGLERIDICKILKHITLTDTFLDFSDKVKSNKELKEICKTFEESLNESLLNNNGIEVKKQIIYFRCYNELMYHQLNSIYWPWYRTDPPQMSAICDKVCRILKEEKLKKKKDKGKNNLENIILKYFEE